MKIVRTSRESIFRNIKTLEEEKYNYEIYTDVDDSKENVYITIPKDRKNKKIKRFKGSAYIDKENYLSYRVSKEFALLLANESDENMYNKICSKEMTDNIEILYIHRINIMYIDREIKNILKEVKDSKKIEKIKFYIEMPYLRTIIPVLEELKQNEIEYSILPIDDKQEMNRPKIRIYMNRSDLQKYKESVHNKISTKEKGIIKIGEENIDLSIDIIQGCQEIYKKEDKNKER